MSAFARISALGRERPAPADPEAMSRRAYGRAAAAARKIREAPESMEGLSEALRGLIGLLGQDNQDLLALTLSPNATRVNPAVLALRRSP